VTRIALVAGVAALLAAGLAGAAPRQFTNPVFRSDFPDPFVLRAGSTYYAYATNSVSANVQTLRSTDLVHWRRGKDAMPNLAPWTLRGRTWAPEVLRVGPGRYVLYYTARSFDLDSQCVGRAVSRSPAGPFVDRSSKPLVCQKKEGGSIDPDGFRDTNGHLYLVWKNDGNCCGFPTYLYSQRLSKDGLGLVGKRVRLVRNDAAWESTTVEAPTMWKQAGKYFLFFSANVYNTSFYAVGYATCAGPLGPCKDSKDNPILSSACRAAGPGHQTLIRDRKGRTWIVYHAWPPSKIGSVTPGRQLWIDRLDWRGGKPVVHGPTCKPQPAP
jgi:beta-xylosidase